MAGQKDTAGQTTEVFDTVDQTTEVDEEVQTYPPKKSYNRQSDDMWQANFWDGIHRQNVADKFAFKVVNNLTREQRDKPDQWTDIRNNAAHQFAKDIVVNPEHNKYFIKLTHEKIIDLYCNKFIELLVSFRYNDYFNDYETKNTESEPNEVTDVSHIDKALYEKYFSYLDTNTVCSTASNWAEGCVRAKRTHIADVVLALCKLAVTQTNDPKKLENINNWISEVGYFAVEAHYMGDTPGAAMRFDDD